MQSEVAHFSAAIAEAGARVRISPILKKNPVIRWVL
jgi:hypothetical protein